jgi:hypothetical protein
MTRYLLLAAAVLAAPTTVLALTASALPAEARPQFLAKPAIHHVVVRPYRRMTHCRTPGIDERLRDWVVNECGHPLPWGRPYPEGI